MGPSQPGQAPGAPAQQLYRQVQIMVNEALRTLDAARPLDQASEAEVESLRAAIWSDLTALEAEFGREDGPRADRLERFFQHLLSSGDHIGQIEALGGALLGGAPPSQPPPDSPAAGLHRLHNTLSGIRRQWRELSPGITTQPPASATIPNDWRNLVADGTSPESVEKRGLGEEILVQARRSTVSRPTTPPTRKGSGSERLLDDLGFASASPPTIQPEVDPLRPRVLLSFVAVFVVLMLVGVGVIYWGLSSSQPDDVGALPTGAPTSVLGTSTAGTPHTTPTPNPGPPVLQVLGKPVEVPCLGQGAGQFEISNTGGGVLNWIATTKPQNEVSLDMTTGQLSGGLATSIVTVMVTALVSSGNGTITITTNIPGPGGTQAFQFHIQGC